MTNKTWIAAACLLVVGCGTAPAVTNPPPTVQASKTAPLIVLDPGHNPEKAGAISVWGTDEVTYNDLFVTELAPALRTAGWQVQITRASDQSISLLDRAKFANKLKASLFLSVHHDSVQLRCLKQVPINGRTAYQTLQPTGGYSLYVSKENPDFSASYRLASALGEQLHALDRAPMLVHAGKACGENRPLLNPQLGIYQYDRLAVLRHSKIPAVLLEVGVITDIQDEAYISNAGNRQKMIAGIVRAIQQYFQ